MSSRLGRRDRPPPEADELISATERSWSLQILRLGIGIVVVVVGFFVSDLLLVPYVTLVGITAGYAAISVALFAFARPRPRVAMAAARATILLDGLYLVAVIAVTGGAVSQLRFLLFVHAVAAILLFSYRTGLKVAIWDSVLFVTMAEAQRSGMIVGPADEGSGLPIALTLVALWLITLVTATLSAESERELRGQKVDLSRLSEMVAKIDAGADPERISGILIDSLVETFGFERGLVLAAPSGPLVLMATTHGEERIGSTLEATDPIIEEAWAARAPLLRRALDPATAPEVARLLADAHNVIVVPMVVDGTQRVGVVVVEGRRFGMGVRRWIVAMAGQFVAHASLALRNAWLTEERERQLERIRVLERSLRNQNARLETTVEERTRELRDAIVHLEQVDEQRRRLLDHVVKVAEEERTRVANDLHDDPVQKMVSLKMRLELLIRSHPELGELTDAHEVVRATIQGLRQMLFALRPPILDEQGLGPAIQHLLEHSDVPFTWSVNDDAPFVRSGNVRLILYRIAQEALANARKHAEAETVHVRVRERDGGFLMEIVDDGVGFLPQEAVIAAPGHLGLAAMRERAEMAGGRCTLHSLPGAGTTLEVWIPADDSPLASGSDLAEAIAGGHGQPRRHVA